MVHEDTLSSVLSDFARTMLTDFPIQGILDHLVERIVDVLPVTGAGVTLIQPGLPPKYIAASNEQALRFERLQTDLGEGPCITAFELGERVAVPDLASDSRYPTFAPAAVSAGMAAVFTFPLRHGDGRLGALDLYRDVPGALDVEDEAAAQTLADVAAAYLLNAQARAQAHMAAEWFRERSLHDALTGLPNRVLLQERLEHASLRAQRTHKAAAVLFVDLDRFKRVNDDYGHSAGDELLVAVAQRLSQVVRPGDTLARVSGDEFVYLCEDLAHASDVELLAGRIDAAFAEPFSLSGVTLGVTASVGIAYAGPGERVTDGLVLDADMAMYQAKRRGGGTHQVIDLRLAAETHERNQLERDLQVALANADLAVAYQPIVRTEDGFVTGVEALLRWTIPDRGPIPAATAVAVAEQSGLITRIGAWVLERACWDRVDWLANHPGRPLDLSVNVSPRQLMAPGFAKTVAGVLERTRMDPAALVLEVTEGILVEDGDRAMRVLRELKALGVRLALDDFGTGYCSLTYLRRFPIDIVKIDQTFVADIGRDPASSAIVAAVTSLSHVLGMHVTAEGVETEEQREEVVSIGCELAQGYLFARPMTARDLALELELSDA
ncbi:putative bifunctional diguanylate cyclase/phosphodiesterase [Pengzhenrongella sp.]|uniref:putative bifunctional diguanylate cyclase/phosphodiesterase n=1 Tax=Pengzhenrongella sp. TaxID=2888820 RepID=UPI002F9439E9